MTNIGYARISTDEQTTDLQVDALRRAGCDIIYQDVMSGMKTQRPELDKALAHLHTGDTFVVWKIDRMSRSTKHLIYLRDFFLENNIVFCSLTENIDTTTPYGKMFFTILGAIAEIERDTIVQRVKAGIQAAHAKGKKFGRTPALNNDKLATGLTLYRSGEYTIAQIAKAVGCSPSTIKRWIVQPERQSSQHITAE